MDVAVFEDSPIGRLVRISGHDARLDQDYRHWAYVPNPLPPVIDLHQATYKALSEADRALGALDARTSQLPNPRLLIRPSLQREALATSALEGTYAPFEDVVEADYVDARQQSAQVREINNYVQAAHLGLELIETKPICLSVIAELQAALVRGTRGESYDSGRLRERQVCVGDPGQSIEQSRFVPPPHGDELRKGMSDWERWINADDDIPLIVKAAVGHYQFETLHPFGDGNGRLGRLVVQLQLIEAGALRFPLLNLSPWLEPRRTAYVDHLLRVSATGQFDPWVAFFAEAVKARSDAARATIDELLEFRDGLLTVLRAEGARGLIVDVAHDLIGRTALATTDLVRAYNVSHPSATRIIQRLESLGVLREITGGNYRRLYLCQPVLEIMRDA